MPQPALSVVIPVYNEEAGLPALFARLYPALDGLRIAYEVIFVNDGSHDRSSAILRQQFETRPDVTRVVLFNAKLWPAIWRSWRDFSIPAAVASSRWMPICRTPGGNRQTAGQDG
jgi:glycosyltransferase involved in cell wall biosynthesis